MQRLVLMFSLVSFLCGSAVAGFIAYDAGYRKGFLDGADYAADIAVKEVRRQLNLLVEKGLK